MTPPAPTSFLPAYIHNLVRHPVLVSLRRARRWLLRHAHSCRAAWGEWFWNGCVASLAMPSTLRMFLYRRHRNLHIASTAYIASQCYFEKSRITFGPHAYINKRVSFYGTADIHLGKRCAIGCECMLITVTHRGEFENARAFGGSQELPIVIGEGSWLAARVTVLPGVTIGEGCIIAAGAVVTRDCQPHGLYAGIPAKRVKDLPTGRFKPEGPVMEDFAHHAAMLVPEAPCN